MDISVLFEDNHLLVVEKPVNIPVQEDKSRSKDLLTVLKADLKVRYKKPGNVYLGLVHRLDRPVGGVMVFAKTSKSASRLSDKLRRQAMEREYLAVVRGKPTKPTGELEHYLIKDRQKNKVFAVNKSNKQAKQAKLTYELIGFKEGLSLLSIKLQTGRSHQIRVQLSASKMPIYGDQKYGADINKVGQQIALWSHELAFKHPTKEERLTVTSKPPTQYPWNLWF